MSTPTPAEPGSEPQRDEPQQDEPQQDEPQRSAPEPAARPRGRTAKIMALALALGVVGGGVTGYVVQAARTPTPLPSLAVAMPAYPKTHHASPPLTAAVDDMVKTDGDLTKLLVPAPAGSRPWDAPQDVNGWVGLVDLAGTYDHPAQAYKYQLGLGFRRDAQTAWMQGTTSYEVNLFQYRHDNERSVTSELADAAVYAQQDVGGAPYHTLLPHSSGPGGVYAGPKQLYRPDGTGYYRGFGFAAHGDIAVIIYVYSPNPIDGKPLMTLLQNQLERL